MADKIEAPLESEKLTKLSGMLNKFVCVELIRKMSHSGFLHSVDNNSGSIFILVPKESTFKTVLIPGNAITSITLTESPAMKPPCRTEAPELKESAERKAKVIEVLEKNMLKVEDDGGVLKIGTVEILPPYTAKEIYTDNIMVFSNLRKMLESITD